MKRDGFAVPLIALLFILMTACPLPGSTWLKRKDSVQYVEFPGEIGKETVNFYRIYALDYPETAAEKDKFLNELGVAGARLLLRKQYINLLLPPAFPEDLEAIRNGATFSCEKLYATYASDLTDEEKTLLEEEISAGYPEEFGELQRLINKQYFYWLRYAGREKEYRADTAYTEFDKNELIEEILKKRQENIRTLFGILEDLVVKIDEESLEYCANTPFPVYVKKELLDQTDVRKGPKLVILTPGDRESVYPGKVALTVGTESKTLRDYKITPLIFPLSSVRDIYTRARSIPKTGTGSKKNAGRSIRTKDLLGFKLKENDGGKKRKPDVGRKDPPRSIPAFDEQKPEWVIE
ncbi:MAG: hypothetical protein LBQ96_07330 [Fusobacteriaceae bacterium]|jgi:hypothetical protein|nr:hypothetical protein [Fusobacteriaceae bacterium]